MFTKLFKNKTKCRGYWTTDLQEVRRLIKLAAVQGIPILDEVINRNPASENELSDDPSAVSVWINWKSDGDWDPVGLRIVETYCEGCEYYKPMTQDDLIQEMRKYAKKHGRFGNR